MGEHPLTYHQSPEIIPKLEFAHDNTINDKPVEKLLTCIETLFNQACIRINIPTSLAYLSQLVLIIADGMFHEKENFKTLTNELCIQKGIIPVFIFLDTPQNSLLNLQSLNIQEGKLIFSRYLENFPFPYYLLIRDIDSL